jgi:hypothetical protein
MATFEDLQRLALELPGVTLDDVDLSLDGGPFVWAWRERIDPNKPKVTNFGVAVLPVENETRKHELIAAQPDIFFTEPHYNGYAAVLVRLEAITVDRLREALAEARDVRLARNARRRPRRSS